MAKELDDKRRQVEEAELRLQQEREQAEKEHERMVERMNYEQEEKDKIVCEILSSQNSILFSRVKRKNEYFFSAIMAFEQSCLFLGIFT
jgi:predicted RecB family nuclease